MSVTPISKQILKAQRSLIQDQIAAKTAQIDGVQIQLTTLKNVKDGLVAEKVVLQQSLADLNQDIGE